MNNTPEKSTQKICPIFGSHASLVTGKLKGVAGQQLMGTQLDLAVCVGSKCMFWTPDPGICQWVTLVGKIWDIEISLDQLGDTLENLSAIISDLKEQKHGDS